MSLPILTVGLAAGPTFANVSVSFQLEDGINLTISVSVSYSYDHIIISNVIPYTDVICTTVETVSVIFHCYNPWTNGI